MILQLSGKSAHSREVRGSETLVYEPPLEPVQQNAHAGFGHAWVAGQDDKRAVARSDGFGYAHAGVASERHQPGHLGANRVRRVNVRSVDAQEVRPISPIDPEGCVVLVTLEGQLRVLKTVSRQGRSPEAAKPNELLAPAKRCKCFDTDRLYPGNSHSRSMLLGTRWGGVVVSSGR